MGVSRAHGRVCRLVAQLQSSDDVIITNPGSGDDVSMARATPAAAAEQAQEACALEENRYLFELQGFCVVQNVLSQAEVCELNAVIDARPEMGSRGNNSWVGNARFGENPGAYDHAINASSDAWRGSPGMLEWGEQFTRLLDHPRILPYLAMFLDGHIPSAATCAQGHGDSQSQPMTPTSGPTGIRLDRLYGIEQTVGAFRQGGLHQDWEGQYSFQRGAIRNSLIVVAWNLTDTGGKLGGFCTLPGSHKANLPIPPSFNWRMNGPDNGTPPGVVCPEATAGSCILFSEASVHATHGFLDPTHKRRVLLYKYAQKHIAQGQDAVPPTPGTLSKRQALLFSSPQEGRAVTFRPLDYAQEQNNEQHDGVR